jgi:hypothetical protein
MTEQNDIIKWALEQTPQAAIRDIVQALKGIQYGAVEIVIHEGRIVQIERKEKLRLDTPSRMRASN